MHHVSNDRTVFNSETSVMRSEPAPQQEGLLANAVDVIRLNELIGLLAEREFKRSGGDGLSPDGKSAIEQTSTPTQLQELLKTVARLQSERDKATADLARRFEEIVTLTQLLEEARSRSAAGQSQIVELKGQVAEGKVKSERLRVAHAKLTAKIKSLDGKVQRYQVMQNELSARLDAERNVSPIEKLIIETRKTRMRIAALRHRQRAMRVGGKTFPGGEEALAHSLERLEKTVFFDSDWYLTRYPDVAESNALPQLHYLRFGAAEGRDPSPIFNTSRYLALYPDVAAAKLNPLVHYVTHGAREGRIIELAQVK